MNEELRSSLQGIMRLLNKNITTNPQGLLVTEPGKEEYVNGITDTLACLDSFLSSLKISIDADLLGYYIKEEKE